MLYRNPAIELDCSQDAVLGEGAVGKVYKGRLNGQVVAVKIVREGETHEQNIRCLCFSIPSLLQWMSIECSTRVPPGDDNSTSLHGGTGLAPCGSLRMHFDGLSSPQHMLDVHRRALQAVLK